MYNEKVRDLLSNGAIREPSKVRVREHPIFGPYVSGDRKTYIRLYIKIIL